MIRHLENMRKFGVNPVVAINVFSDDTDKEIAAVREEADMIDLVARALEARQ